MLGAICGDVIGSVHERAATKTTQFKLFERECRFTDDTVLTVAVADAIMSDEDYGTTIHRYARAYPKSGFGSKFRRWLRDDNPQPYNSWGNGSAMRVSPVGWIARSAQHALDEAARSAAPTHGHAEGVKGAQAVAMAIYLARTGKSKEAIRDRVAAFTGYDLARTIDGIRPRYRFESTSALSVPEAIIAFLEAADYEDAVRLAISLGGDADTQAAIAGSIAEAFWGEVPPAIVKKVWRYLPTEFIVVIEKFYERNVRLDSR